MLISIIKNIWFTKYRTETVNKGYSVNTFRVYYLVVDPADSGNSIRIYIKVNRVFLLFEICLIDSRNYGRLTYPIESPLYAGSRTEY